MALAHSKENKNENFAKRAKPHSLLSAGRSLLFSLSLLLFLPQSHTLTFDILLEYSTVCYKTVEKSLELGNQRCESPNIIVCLKSV